MANRNPHNSSPTLRDARRLASAGVEIRIADGRYRRTVQNAVRWTSDGAVKVVEIPAHFFVGGSKAVARVANDRGSYAYDKATEKVRARFPGAVPTQELDRLVSILGPKWTGEEIQGTADRETNGQDDHDPEIGDLDASFLDSLHANASDECNGEADNTAPDGQAKGSPSVTGNLRDNPTGAPSPVTTPVSNASASECQPCGNGASREPLESRFAPPSGRAAGKAVGPESSDGFPAMSEKPDRATSDDHGTDGRDSADLDGGRRQDHGEATDRKPSESDPSGRGDTEVSGTDPSIQGMESVLSNLESKKGNGGEYADLSGMQKPAVDLSRDARQIKTALEKIFALMDVSDHGDVSPRIRGKALVRELVSRRVNLSRCRREELDHRKIIILVDVSGSCEHVAGDMVKAALAIYATCPERLAVVAHSNGCYNPDRGYWNDRIVGLDPEKITDPSERYGEPKITFKRMLGEIAGVVAFGDSDAADVYQSICEAGIPLVWLDHYVKSYRQERKTRAVNIFPMEGNYRTRGWKARPLAWIGGVTNGNAAAAALRQVAKDKAKWKR